MMNSKRPWEGKIKILVVEDNPGDATLLKIALQETNLSTELKIVEDLISLFATITTFSPDILILDLGLPGTFGISTLEKVTAVTTSIPIIVLTSLSDDELALEALRLGAQDYLVKGEFSPLLVQRVILYAIERHKSSSELSTLSMAINQSPTSIIVTDRDGLITFANPVCLKSSGYTADEVQGKKPSIFKSGLTPPQVYEDLWKTITSGNAWRGELLNTSKTGQLYWVLAVISPVKNSFGEISHFIAVNEDITQAKKQTEEIEYLATHDPLTQLPNRTLLIDRIDHAIEKCRRNGTVCSVLMIDLDDFKLINDTYGHLVGDRLLCAFAEFLVESLRDMDSISRQGGDEFVILLEGLHSSDDAMRVAAKIINRLKDPIPLDQGMINLRCSIGCSTFPVGGETASHLLRTADIAMYKAKSGDKNTVRCFEPAMDTEISARQFLSNELKSAILKDEFELFYQPQISIKNLHLVGLEALIRWRHPERGLIMPGMFIEVAEQMGLIVDIGDWVIATACAHLRDWIDQGLSVVPVSVNVSASQFQRYNFFEKLTSTLASYKLDPHLMDLEITESTLMEYPQKFLKILDELVGAGITTSIDDFGTGYSSLSHLNRLNTSRIKIDKSFVERVDIDSDERIIVSMIINFGKNLKQKILAEGVENQAQLAALATLGCDEVQGYLFSRPKPHQEITDLLRHRPLVS
jgi:diguanylate cyclase (GGDEF)-like protein/PAS domain S-box-containing protein